MLAAAISLGAIPTTVFVAMALLGAFLTAYSFGAIPKINLTRILRKDDEWEERKRISDCIFEIEKHAYKKRCPSALEHCIQIRKEFLDDKTATTGGR